MKLSRYDITAIVLAMMPILVSCRQELCYDHFPEINLQLAWEREWERDYGHHHSVNWDTDHYGFDYETLKPDMPEWVNMINYYDDGHTSEGFLTPDGKRYIVEAGKGGSMLLYNGDTEYIVLSDVASLNDARAAATSRSRSSLSAMYEKYQNSRTTNPPDILYAAFIENMPGLKNHDRHDMPVKMQPLVYTYVINYEFEYGLQHVVLARGAIGGMAESVYLRTGVTSEQTSIILFDCDVKSTGCRANVRSFGVPGFPDAYYGRTGERSDDRPYTLNLELRLRNGKTIEYDYDITDQLKNQPRGGVITVSGIRVEDQEDYSESGFDVDVTDWADASDIIDLPIGNQKGAQ